MPAAKWLAALALRRGYGCIEYGYGPRECVGFPSRGLFGRTVRGACFGQLKGDSAGFAAAL